MNFALRAVGILLLCIVLYFAGSEKIALREYYDSGLAKYNDCNYDGPDGAMADFDRAIKINPRYALAYNGRGLVEYDEGNLDGAMTDYNRAIELDPNEPYAYFNRGRVKYKKNDLDGAIADNSRTIELDPKYAQTYANRGNAKAAKGDQAGAASDFQRAHELDPKFVAPATSSATGQP